MLSESDKEQAKGRILRGIDPKYTVDTFTLLAENSPVEEGLRAALRRIVKESK